jgi:hypothetical protein
MQNKWRDHPSLQEVVFRASTSAKFVDLFGLVVLKKLASLNQHFNISLSSLTLQCLFVWRIFFKNWWISLCNRKPFFWWILYNFGLYGQFHVSDWLMMICVSGIGASSAGIETSADVVTSQSHLGRFWVCLISGNPASTVSGLSYIKRVNADAGGWFGRAVMMSEAMGACHWQSL